MRSPPTAGNPTQLFRAMESQVTRSANSRGEDPRELRGPLFCPSRSSYFRGANFPFTSARKVPVVAPPSEPFFSQSMEAL